MPDNDDNVFFIDKMIQDIHSDRIAYSRKAKWQKAVYYSLTINAISLIALVTIINLGASLSDGGIISKETARWFVFVAGIMSAVAFAIVTVNDFLGYNKTIVRNEDANGHLGDLELNINRIVPLMRNNSLSWQTVIWLLHDWHTSVGARSPYLATTKDGMESRGANENENHDEGVESVEMDVIDI